MSILIYAESAEGKIKKVALELASYAKKVAASMNTTVTAVTINNTDNSALATYGVDKVLTVADEKLNNFSAKAYADVLVQAAKKEGAQIILVSSSTDSLYLSIIQSDIINSDTVICKNQSIVLSVSYTHLTLPTKRIV